MAINKKILLSVSVGVAGLATAVVLFFLGGEATERWSFAIAVGSIAALANALFPGTESLPEDAGLLPNGAADALRSANLDAHGVWSSELSDTP